MRITQKFWIRGIFYRIFRCLVGLVFGNFLENFHQIESANFFPKTLPITLRTRGWDKKISSFQNLIQLSPEETENQKNTNKGGVLFFRNPSLFVFNIGVWTFVPASCFLTSCRPSCLGPWLGLFLVLVCWPQPLRWSR